MRGQLRAAWPAGSAGSSPGQARGQTAVGGSFGHPRHLLGPPVCALSEAKMQLPEKRHHGRRDGHTQTRWHGVACPPRRPHQHLGPVPCSPPRAACPSQVLRGGRQPRHPVSWPPPPVHEPSCPSADSRRHSACRCGRLTGLTAPAVPTFDSSATGLKATLGTCLGKTEQPKLSPNLEAIFWHPQSHTAPAASVGSPDGEAGQMACVGGHTVGRGTSVTRQSAGHAVRLLMASEDE